MSAIVCRRRIKRGEGVEEIFHHDYLFCGGGKKGGGGGVILLPPRRERRCLRGNSVAFDCHSKKIYDKISAKSLLF